MRRANRKWQIGNRKSATNTSRRVLFPISYLPFPTSRGFTLVEVVTTIVILTCIMIAVAAFQFNVLNFNNTAKVSLINTQEAQAILKVVARELRSMEPSSNGSYPIASAATNTITFYTDLDADGTKEQIRYYVASSTLYRGLTRSTGNPPTYVAANETRKIIATGIRNSPTTPIFEYYNSSYAGTTTPLTYPLIIPVIRLVRVNFTIDSDPNKSPLVRTFSTQAALRNLKDNL